MSANADIQDEAVLETKPPSVNAPSVKDSAHHHSVRSVGSAALSVTIDSEEGANGEIDNRQPALHILLSKISDEPLMSKTDLISKLDKSLSQDNSQLSLHDADGKTALHVSSEHGLMDAAEWLIDAGADHSTNAATPLYEAAWNRHVDVVELLLEAGDNTQALTGTDWSSLHAASWNGHAEVVSRLLDKDKSNIDSLEQKDIWTTLNAAVYDGHAHVVCILLKHGSTLATQDNDGWSPLSTAASQHPGLIEKLLESRWPVASLTGFVGGVSRLIDAGADLSAQDIDHDTALRRASGARDYKLGSDDLTDEDRHNAKFADLSADRHGAVVQLLLNVGAANLWARNKNGRTALYLAFKEYRDTEPPNETVMRILLKFSKLDKADFGVDDVWEEAVEWAAGNSKTHDIAQLLFEKKMKASQPPRLSTGTQSGGRHMNETQMSLPYSFKPLLRLMRFPTH
ncbi:hypothetical protein V2G26_013383 [Clonostachys chloroleuca]